MWRVTDEHRRAPGEVDCVPGSRALPVLKVESLRLVFVVILLLIAIEMGWRAVTGI